MPCSDANISNRRRGLSDEFQEGSLDAGPGLCTSVKKLVLHRTTKKGGK